MAKVRTRPSFELELLELLTSLKVHNLSKANMVINEIDNGLKERLSLFPEMYDGPDAVDIREYPMKCLPLIIAYNYCHDLDTVFLLRLIHQNEQRV